MATIKREVLGVMPCPECGFEGAEVKRQKNEGLAYRFCPDCNAQYFARTPETTDRLLKKVGFSPVTVTEQKPAAQPVPEPAPPVPAKVIVKRSPMADALAFMTGNA